MPAAARSLVSDCSQTRSGIHMPLTGVPKRSLEPFGVAGDLTDAIAASRSSSGSVRRTPRRRFRSGRPRPVPPGDRRIPDAGPTSHSISEPLVWSAIGNRRILLEDVEKRPVAVLVRLFEHAVEVADRLMIMEDEDESQGRAHVDHPAGSRCRSGQCRERGAEIAAEPLSNEANVRSYRNPAQCVYPDEPV